MGERRQNLLFFLPFFVMLGITTLVWASFSYYLGSTLIEREQLGRLSQQAQALRPGLSAMLAAKDDAGIQAHCKKLKQRFHSRVTVLYADGTVVGDTDGDPGLMDNHANRPELEAAREQGVGQAARFSFTLNQSLIYSAIRIDDQEGEVLGYIRTSASGGDAAVRLRGFTIKLVIGGLLLLLLSWWVTSLLTRERTRFIRRLTIAADRFAAGDVKYRVAAINQPQLGLLGETMNRMAAQLEQQIATVVQQRNQLKTLFESMTDGILAIDAESQVLDVNRAASQQLGVNPEGARGQHLQYISRDPDLHDLVEEVLKTGGTAEAELSLQTPKPMTFHVRGTELLQGEDRSGALVVLQDITRMRVLENVRRDFVANVSHELKTPVTAIKGFAETLEDGALEDPEDAKRFVHLMNRQADRLISIIEDLLQLSHLEQRDDVIPRQTVILRDVLDLAAQGCASLGRDTSKTIEVSCPESIEARINPPLFEQAIFNLLDNGMKYCDPETTIRVTVEETDDVIRLAVADEGPGIAPEHLDRLFERFYRVDKARSRKAGGTGLGLSIVKHIVHAHGGAISVESTLGKGTTFTIALPINKNDR